MSFEKEEEDGTTLVAQQVSAQLICDLAGIVKDHGDNKESAVIQRVRFLVGYDDIKNDYEKHLCDKTFNKVADSLFELAKALFKATEEEYNSFMKSKTH